MAEQTGATFEEIASQAEQEKVQEVAVVVSTTVTSAQAIEVRTEEEARGATEFLAQIAKAKKDAESARKFLVKPLNDHVKAINEEFKAKLGPLAEADQIVRQKVIAYNAEQERIRAEEQARIDAEAAARRAEEEEKRRAAEAEAQRAREAAAREAARLEAEAKAAEEQRRRELAREADGIAQRAADAPEPVLRSAANRQDAFGQAARDELDRRRKAREAQEAAAAARQREEEARAAEEAARNAPVADVPTAVVAAPTGPVHTASGSASTRKRWVATIEHPERVPRQYMVPDQKAINAAVRGGTRAIPGVRIEQVDELSVRAA